MSLTESGPLDYKAVLWYLFTFAKQQGWGEYCFGKGIQKIFCYRFLRTGQQVLGHQEQEIIHERKTPVHFFFLISIGGLMKTYQTEFFFFNEVIGLRSYNHECIFFLPYLNWEGKICSNGNPAKKTFHREDTVH